MSNKAYHHGNLKNALIEAGIEIINETGEDNLSLRKVAARCGVSSAAPYAHFKDKEEIIQAMQEHVTASFMDCLEMAINPYRLNQDYEGALLAMGCAYVQYFLDHPAYFSFLFSQPCLKVELSIRHTPADNFPPYQLLRDITIKWSETLPDKFTDDELEIRIIQLWASVHGISTIAMMKNVTWDKDWTDEIRHILI